MCTRIVKLADGTWLIAENTDGRVTYGDWSTTISFRRYARLTYDPDRVTAHGNPITKVDLSKVDEIGWAIRCRAAPRFRRIRGCCWNRSVRQDRSAGHAGKQSAAVGE